jgi:hypothetical protein
LFPLYGNSRKRYGKAPGLSFAPVDIKSRVCVMAAEKSEVLLMGIVSSFRVDFLLKAGLC